MKLNSVLILLFIIPTLSFGQFKQSVDLIGGLDYSYRNLTTRNDASLSTLVNSIDEAEIGKLNYRFGLNYNYRIKNKFLLRTGIRFTSVGYQTKESNLRQAYMIAMVEVDPSVRLKSLVDYHFLEIPIVGRWEWEKTRWTPFFELGVIPSIFLQTRIKAVVPLDNEIQTIIQTGNDFIENPNKFHLVGFLSFGVNYHLSDQLQLFGQPAFRYHFMSVSADGVFGIHLLSTGLEVGLRKKLK